MKVSIVLLALLLTGCKVTDVQYPPVMRDAEIQCEQREGLKYLDAVSYDTVYGVDALCNDGTRLQYKLKRDTR